jgi:hypothetical protein
MTTNGQEHPGVELQSTADRPSHLEAWIAFLGLVSILFAYAVREFVLRAQAVDVVTNFA